MNVVEGSTTTIVLPSYKVVPSSVVTFGLGNDDGTVSNGLTSDPDDRVQLAAVPGTTFLEWGEGDGINAVLEFGKVTEVDFGDLSQRRSTVIRTADTAEFPDGAGCAGTIGISNNYSPEFGFEDPEYSNFAFYMMVPNWEMRVAQHESVDFGLTENEPYMHVNGFAVPITFSSVGAASTETEVFRIDVNDVLLNGVDVHVC